MASLDGILLHPIQGQVVQLELIKVDARILLLWAEYEGLLIWLFFFITKKIFLDFRFVICNLVDGNFWIFLVA